ncbi:hypothetical protein CJU90_2912 [Yarrowia sp. C11]|nr:hypothetical protein CKK34_4362 [Yarrowia sp. E02]KAG5369458.1 hypothetical protein CJU90_2912 [Yarrowia sp. C11]
MPRKRPRNVLKRDSVPLDQDPEDFASRKKSKFTKKKGKFAKDNYNEKHDDDTPKSFKRMMARQDRSNQSQDDERGRKTAKKDQYPTNKHISHENSKLQMKPGESWADFSRRVDEALPNAKPRRSENAKELSKLDKKNIQKQKNRVLQNEMDYKKEDEAAEEGDGLDEKRLKNDLFFPKKQRDKSPDPWAVLEKKNKKAKFGEVADAPPVLNLPRKLLPNVPKSSGDNARRLILEAERQKVIDEYRKISRKDDPTYNVDFSNATVE